ncbi:MAG: DUF58 domain-containing protein [Gemmataceae bacterium]|nr:DUF58 domain-containing protein [Gemmataceae bacterium]
MDDPHKYLDPHALAKVRSLELQARLIVEGYLSGMHKSPYHGFSVEFTEHREYVPGDDLKHLDWKVYSRLGRFYVKQYEQETNLDLWVLVDSSESMAYGSGPKGDDGKPLVRKYDYACMAAAALCYLTVHQQDGIGMVTYDDAVRNFLRPSSQMSQLKQVVNILNRGPGPQRTRLAPIMHDLAERIGRRGILVLLSDCFDELDDILAGLKHLRHRRHEVVVMQVLDPAELSFPFGESTLFRGLEQTGDLLTDPRSLRDGYLEEILGFNTQLQRGCLMQNIDHIQLRTDGNLGKVLATYLAHRLARSK